MCKVGISVTEGRQSINGLRMCSNSVKWRQNMLSRLTDSLQVSVSKLLNCLDEILCSCLS